MNEAVELDVGGTSMTVGRKTLMMVEGSNLAALFSGKADIIETKENRVFLDRDPAIF